MDDQLNIGTGNAAEAEGMDVVKNSHVLHGRNAGCSLKLLGKVVLVTFLICDGECDWDEESEKAAVDMLKRLCKRIELASGKDVKDLSVTYAYCKVKIPYVVSRENRSQFIQDVLVQFGQYKDVDAYQRHYEQKFSRDEACITFLLNKGDRKGQDARSYASQVTSESATDRNPSPSGSEYSIVFFDGDNSASSERAMLHELLHQFGAIDFYYPPALQLEAKCHLPGSIMDSGENIDSLTRYIIGWDDTLAADAQKFLEAISNISPETIERARRSEWTD